MPELITLLIVSGCSFLETRPALGSKADSRPYWRKLVLLVDWVSPVVALGFFCCSCLAFQCGGVTQAWSSGTVIALLVMIPVSLGVLVAYTVWLGQERAMLPLYFFRRRTIMWVAPPRALTPSRPLIPSCLLQWCHWMLSTRMAFLHGTHSVPGDRFPSVLLPSCVPHHQH